VARFLKTETCTSILRFALGSVPLGYFRYIYKKVESKMQTEPHQLQHRLDLIGNLERSAGLRLDFIYRHTVGKFDEGETLSKVNIEHAL